MLEGVDQLLFVLALMLIVTGLKPLVKAVTAFTKRTVLHWHWQHLASSMYRLPPPKPSLL